MVFLHWRKPDEIWWYGVDVLLCCYLKLWWQVSLHSRLQQTTVLKKSQTKRKETNTMIQLMQSPLWTLIVNSDMHHLENDCLRCIANEDAGIIVQEFSPCANRIWSQKVLSRGISLTVHNTYLLVTIFVYFMYLPWFWYRYMSCLDTWYFTHSQLNR